MFDSDETRLVPPRKLSADAEQAATAFGFENGIPGDIDPTDFIFWYIVDNTPGHDQARAAVEYLQSGAGGAQLLKDCLHEARVAALLDVDRPKRPRSILEFASGYGRVTRHFPRLLPDWKIVGCDIHQQAVSFLQRLGYAASLSSARPDAFALGTKFDVIYAFSFFTHMPRATWTAWLAALGRHLVDDGVLVFTAHGEVSQGLMGVLALEADGFFFHSASEQKDLPASEYGNTVTAFSFVSAQLEQCGLNLVQYKQAGAGHHDLYIAHKPKRFTGYANDGSSAELRRQLALREGELLALQQSRSWRVMAPVRALARAFGRGRQRSSREDARQNKDLEALR